MELDDQCIGHMGCCSELPGHQYTTGRSKNTMHRKLLPEMFQIACGDRPFGDINERTTVIGLRMRIFPVIDSLHNG